MKSILPIIALLFLVACAAPPTPAPTPTPSSTPTPDLVEHEAYAVYNMIVSGVTIIGNDPLLWKTCVWNETDEVDTVVLEQLQDVTPDLLNAFKIANRESVELKEDLFASPVELATFDRLESSREFPHSCRDIDEFWLLYDEQYVVEHQIYVTQFSHVGFNDSLDKALVVFAYSFGPNNLDGGSLLHYLEKRDGVWQFEDRIVLWEAYVE